MKRSHGRLSHTYTFRQRMHGGSHGGGELIYGYESKLPGPTPRVPTLPNTAKPKLKVAWPHAPSPDLADLVLPNTKAHSQRARQQAITMPQPHYGACTVAASTIRDISQAHTQLHTTQQAGGQACPRRPKCCISIHLPHENPHAYAV